MVLFADISKSLYNRGIKGCLIFFYILMGILREKLSQLNLGKQHKVCTVVGGFFDGVDTFF